MARRQGQSKGIQSSSQHIFEQHLLAGAAANHQGVAFHPVEVLHSVKYCEGQVVCVAELQPVFQGVW